MTVGATLAPEPISNLNTSNNGCNNQCNDSPPKVARDQSANGDNKNKNAYTDEIVQFVVVIAAVVTFGMGILFYLPIAVIVVGMLAVVMYRGYRNEQRMASETTISNSYNRV